MLKNIKGIILTWSLASQMEDRCLQNSMTESLKCTLSHLWTEGDDIALDSGGDKDESDLNHRTSSQDNGESESFDNNEVHLSWFSTELQDKNKCLTNFTLHTFI